MKKCFVKVLPLMFVLAIMLAGCGGSKVDIGTLNKEAQNNGGQTSTENSSEQSLSIENCIPLEDVLKLNHRDGGGDYLYLDPIPVEYWNIEDAATSSKGIATQFEGKIYKLYANGKVVDEAGNVKQKVPQDLNDEESIFTAWILVLREEDMLGRDAVYNNMSYDVEKVMTVDELRNLIHIVHITEENFNEYFSFIEVEEEKEITGSNFVENHVYKPYRTLGIAYHGPGYLMNSGSFKWAVDVAVSYKYKEKITREEYDSQGNMTENVSYDSEEQNRELTIDDYVFVYQEEGEYRNITHHNAFPNLDPLLYYYINSEHDYLTKIQHFYEDLTVKKAQGYLIYCDDIPEEFWNVTEKGNRYICVQREDKPAWRFCEYGRIGADNTDVDRLLGMESSATIDGTPIQKREDVLCINGNDLNNFIGITLESLHGFSN